jgi:hypothetical protein
MSKQHLESTLVDERVADAHFRLESFSAVRSSGHVHRSIERQQTSFLRLQTDLREMRPLQSLPEHAPGQATDRSWLICLNEDAIRFNCAKARLLERSRLQRKGPANP